MEKSNNNKAMKKHVLFILVLCWFAYACIYFGRVNLSVVLTEIQKYLHVGKSQVGILGSIFLWIYGAGQLINGYIGDRVSSRLYIFIGLFITALANILFGFAASLFTMCIIWAFNGFAQSMIWGPIAKTISNWVSAEKTSGAVVAVSTSVVGGFLLAWGLSAKIITQIGWKWMFWIPGITIMTFSLIWVINARNKPEEAGLTSQVKEENIQECKSDIKAQDYPLLKVICESKLWLVAVACIAQGIVKDGINLWAPTFFIESYKVNINSVTAVIIFIPIMNFFGMLFSGWLNKVMHYKEKIATILMFVLGMLMILGLITLGGKNIILGLIFLGLSSAFMYGADTLLIGVVPLHFKKYNKVSTISGMLNFTAYMVSGCMTAISGFIIQFLGWKMMLVFWMIISVIGGISLTVSNMYDKRSEEKIIISKIKQEV